MSHLIDPEEQSLIEAALADRTQDAVRLIYADWLEERGDPRADYLRLESQVYRHSVHSRHRPEMQERLQALMRHADAAWLERFDRTRTRCVVDLTKRAGAIYREWFGGDDERILVWYPTGSDPEVDVVGNPDMEEGEHQYLVWETQGLLSLVHKDHADLLAGTVVHCVDGEIHTVFPDSARSTASEPARFRVSATRLRTFFPQWFPGVAVLDESQPSDVQTALCDLTYYLSHGDARAAVVAQLEPLLVAAYTDELDCIAMLEFPAELVAEHALQVGSQLVAACTYIAEGEPAPDLRPGLADTGQYPDFIPHIADFLSADHDRLAAHKARISPAEWKRVSDLARDWLLNPPGQPRPGVPKLQAPSTTW